MADERAPADLVERLAKVAYGASPMLCPWERRSEDARDVYRKVAATVVAAFVAEDPVRRAAQRWVDLFDFVHDYDAGDWWRETDAAWIDLKVALAAEDDAATPPRPLPRHNRCAILASAPPEPETRP